MAIPIKVLTILFYNSASISGISIDKWEVWSPAHVSKKKKQFLFLSHLEDVATRDRRTSFIFFPS